MAKCDGAIINAIGGGKKLSKTAIKNIREAYVNARKRLDRENANNPNWQSKSVEEKTKEYIDAAINFRKANLIKARERKIETAIKTIRQMRNVRQLGGYDANNMSGWRQALDSIAETIIKSGEQIANPLLLHWNNILHQLIPENSLFGIKQEDYQGVWNAFTGVGKPSEIGLKLRDAYKAIDDRLNGALRQLGIEVGDSESLHFSHYLNADVIEQTILKAAKQGKKSFDEAKAEVRQRLTDFFMENAFVYDNEGNKLDAGDMSDEKRAIVESGVESIITDGASSDKMASFRNPSVAKFEESRVFHFNDKKTEFDFIQQFEGISPLDLFKGNIRVKANTIAQIEQLGHSPLTVTNKLINDYVKNLHGAEAKRQADTLKDLFNLSLGVYNKAKKFRLNRAVQNAKLLSTTAKLGKLSLAQFGDLVTMSGVSRIWRVPQMRMWNELFSQITPSARQSWAQNEMIINNAMIDHHTQIIDDYSKAHSTLKNIAAFQSWSNFATGMNRTLKQASAKIVTKLFAELTERDFASLPDFYKGLLTEYGVTPTTFELLRKAGVSLDEDGIKQLTAKGLNKLTAKDIESAYSMEIDFVRADRAARELRLNNKIERLEKQIQKEESKDPNFLDTKEGKRILREMEGISHVLKGYEKETQRIVSNWISRRKTGIIGEYSSAIMRISDDMVTSPTLRQRVYEAAREKDGAWGVTQTLFYTLKTFPIAFFERQMKLYKQVSKQGGMPMANYMAWNMAQLLITGSVLTQAYNVANGKEPEEMSPKFFAKAIFKSGALGLYGDMINQYQWSRGGAGGLAEATGKMLLGPVGSDALSFVSGAIKASSGVIEGGYKGERKVRKGLAEMGKTTLDLVPLANNIYTGTAYNRLIVNNILNEIDPNYKQNIKENARKSGTEFIGKI